MDGMRETDQVQRCSPQSPALQAAYIPRPHAIKTLQSLNYQKPSKP